MSVVALDIGTSRTKALLARWDGRITAVRSTPTPVLADAPGQLAFPADTIREEAASLIAGIAATLPEDPVDTLVFSCLGTAMVPLDRAGRPLGPALSPTDVRAGSVPGLMDQVNLPAGSLFDLTGQDPRLSSFLLHWLWWRHAHPEVTARLHRFRSLRGFLVAWLCGADAEDPSWASRTMLMNLATSAWSEPILAAAGLPVTALPVLLPSTTTWPVHGAAAAALGLAPGAKAVLGGMDNCCAFLGASDPSERRLVNIAGTYEHLAGTGGLAITRAAAGVSNGLVHRYLVGDPYLGYSRLAVGHLLADVEAASPGGLGPLMDGVTERPTGGSIGLDHASVQVALRAGTPPGVVLQALLETSADLLVRFADTWAAGGGRVDRIVAVGGGAAHERVLQLKANLLGRPISTLASDEAAGIGALRLAAMAVRGASPEAACDLFPNPIARTLWPDQARQAAVEPSGVEPSGAPGSRVD
jgi:xylulokinase